MTTRRAFAAVALLLAGAASACRGRPLPGEEGAPRAVVLACTARDVDAETLARSLADRGYDVVRKSTPIERRRSSAAVYDVRRRPERVTEIADLLREAGLADVEVLPFQQHATGGNAVVVWLGGAPAAR
jgi:hypothetical protein